MYDEKYLRQRTEALTPLETTINLNIFLLIVLILGFNDISRQ